MFLSMFPREPAKEKDAERKEWVKHTTDERKWLFENGHIIAPSLRAGQMCSSGILVCHTHRSQAHQMWPVNFA